MDRGLVADGEFVEPGRYRAVTLESVDAALDGVALFVDLGGECGWPAALGSLGAAVRVLVGLGRDGGLDATLAQVRAVGLGGVSLVGQHPVGTGARTATVRTRYPDALQHRDELRAVAALPGGQQHRQRFLALLAGQVHLRGQPATRAPQRVIARLDHDTTGRFPLVIWLPPSARGVLMSPGDRGVHRHIPGNQTGSVGSGLQPGHDPRPDPGPLPAPKQAVDRLPRAVAVWYIPPRRTDPHPPPDPIDELPLAPLRRPTRLLRLGKQRFQPRPRSVGQVQPPRP